MFDISIIIMSLLTFDCGLAAVQFNSILFVWRFFLQKPVTKTLHRVGQKGKKKKRAKTRPESQNSKLVVK